MFRKRSPKDVKATEAVFGNNTLPLDVWHRILSNLSVNDTAQLALTGKSGHKLVTDFINTQGWARAVLFFEAKLPADMICVAYLGPGIVGGFTSAPELEASCACRSSFCCWPLLGQFIDMRREERFAVSA